jgi:CheY-like chemotaxis protein
MTVPFLLLVEDNPDDQFLMQRALRKSGLTLPLNVARDGREALDYLRGADRFADRQTYPVPTLVFLDLKLPYIDGFEVLEWIREHPVLHDLTVVILTSSGEERDAQRAHQLGVSAYLVKPPRPEILIKTITPLIARVPEETAGKSA